MEIGNVLKKVICTLAMLGAMMLAAIADTWADVPDGIEAGTEQLAVACTMYQPTGAIKATKVVRPVYSKPSHYTVPSNMSEAEAKEWIAQRESGGDYSAVSPSGKYIGKYQLSKDKLNGDYSPENQEKVAESYVKSRYGSWENAKAHWEKYGWY